MIDIHCHILFGVDDGSYCLSESVEMAAEAAACGTTAIIATPHVNAPGMRNNAWGRELSDKLEELNAQLRARSIPLTVAPGHEVFCSRGDVVSMFDRGELMTLNRSRYLLIEFDFDDRSDNMVSKCDAFVSRGAVPVVAHPERYAALQEDDSAIYRLKRHGALLQVNGGSLFGGFGRGAENTAHRLLEESLADFIASDAHSPYMRTADLSEAHEMISEMYSPTYASYLLMDAPAMLCADKKIDSYY